MEYQISSNLTELGIEQINRGMCTGTQWFQTNGDLLASVSPADGLEIALVRQTNTINYSSELPLAQGIEFNL